MQITVYQLDPLGFYTGDALADESPLEPGVFLLPSGSVALAPPMAPEGKHPCFINGVWELVPVVPAPEPVTQDGPLHKASQIAALLALRGETRLTIQMCIELAEDRARALAPAYGMTAEEGIAYAYSKNKSYRECKDLETAIRAIEVAP